MHSLNRCQLIGNLTKDPEMKQTTNGATIATFSIATNYSYKDADGIKHDKPEYHNIICFGKLAEICGNYLHKGTKVYADGRIQTRSWEGQDGVKRYSTEIILQNLIILTPKSSSGAVRPKAPTETGIRDNDETMPLDEDGQDQIALEDLPF